MKRKILIALAACMASSAALAHPENWSVYKDDQHGGLILSAMPKAEENDTDLWLMCRKDGRFDVGAGANASVGQGNGEAVSVTLTAGGRSATLHGVSKSSINTEMTGGTELVTTITRTDPLMDVLSAGATIKMKSDSFAAPGKWLTKFLAACPAKK